MATKLTKPLQREITLPGVDKPILVEIRPEGVFASVKGSRTTIGTTWTQVINAMMTPSNVPSFLMGKPMELLRHKGKK